MNKITCDIFCTVVDNYGDIGVSWRLAHQLAHEHGVAVRLWLDDLHTLKRLCPELDVDLARQICREVEVRHWGKDFSEVKPAELVIEAFACELPQDYILAMAARERKPVWVNLEYLSAEDWVDGCHKLPSPRPNLPLVKHFFFPGFTRKTGGLLLEGDLLARRDAFQQNPAALAAFWQGLELPPPVESELRVSLFSYENPAISDLLGQWAAGGQPLTCLVPEGRALPQVAGFFGAGREHSRRPRAGDSWHRGNLRVQVLPFVEQARYDELLWACDVNFVRGEDSFVRAQWAGKPLIWQIYPQHDGVHMQKLHAFLDKYCASLPAAAAEAMRTLWDGWNGEEKTLLPWNDFAGQRSILAKHAHAWAHVLSGNSLALNLLDFFGEVGKMRDFNLQI